MLRRVKRVPSMLSRSRGEGFNHLPTGVIPALKRRFLARTDSSISSNQEILFFGRKRVSLRLLFATAGSGDYVSGFG